VLNHRNHRIERLIGRLFVGAIYVFVTTGIAGMASAATSTPASAEGLFDFFFGAPRRPAPPPSASAYADPSQQFDPFGNRPSEPRVDTAPAVAYCVRLCDGRFFPIQRSGATPAEICSSFCPASHTKVFSGGAIDHAVARDGTHYADLSNAFVYRDKIVPGCTCNGKDAFGLVEMKTAEDPTLRPGDVVATNDGFVTYSGGRNRSADFTPIDSAHSSLSAQWRRELAQTRIAPRDPVRSPAPTTDGLANDPDRHAQADK
jgi:hypothetical protein